jgi:hypothetical protein
MGVTSVRRRTARAAASSRPRAIAPAETAWVAALPCALLTLAAIVWLSRPLGRALFVPANGNFWPWQQELVRPEEAEHAAYVLAIGAPLLLAALVLRGARRPPRLSDAVRRALVLASQASACAFLLVALVAQHLVTYDSRYSLGASFHRAYFTWPTVGVAVVLALGIAAALGDARVRPWLAARLHDTRARRWGALAAAGCFTAVWLLSAINLDSSVGHVNRAVFDMLPWSMDETFAILDGRTPLVSFHAAYAQLWPYLVAGLMAVLGTSIAVYTTVMASIGGIALLSVFAIFRRVAGSSLAALALYLPFLATSFFMERGPLSNRYGPSDLYTIFPVRYAGPFLLAWLLSRQLGRRAPGRTWPLFVLAGLVVLNNLEFGLPAFGATLAACLWARPPRSRRAALGLLGSAAAGGLGALALVVLLTLARSGSLPHLGMLAEFIKLYGVSGWAMLPMPALGFHLVLYATFAAAIVLATVRAASGETDLVLTGMLGWSGVFGLGVGAYYAGRSHPDVLVNIFSAWAFALVLLVVAVVRAIWARASRRPTAIELAVLIGFGLAVCSIAQTPTPWSQVRRLGDATPTPAFQHNAAERFIARETRRGEQVMILNPLGHRIAYDLGLVNLSPYTSVEIMVSRTQLRDAVAVLRAAHASRLFVPLDEVAHPFFDTLQAEGFAVTHLDHASATVELVDTTAGG